MASLCNKTIDRISGLDHVVFRRWEERWPSFWFRLIEGCIRSSGWYNFQLTLLLFSFLKKDQTDSIVANDQSTLYFPGVKQHEATLTLRYNRDRKILTSDVHIPRVDVNFGTNFRITDESTPGKKAYTFVLDFNNKKISEVTLTGKIR